MMSPYKLNILEKGFEHQYIHLYGYHRRHVTHTPVRLAVELSLVVLTTCVCRCWVSNTTLSTCNAKALSYCATSQSLLIKIITYMIKKKFFPRRSKYHPIVIFQNNFTII